MKINSDLLKEIEKYCIELLSTKLSDKMIYHNLEHTKNVVNNTKIIASKENLTADEFDVAVTCAWFHDVGYIKKYLNNENESVAIASAFLEHNHIDKDVIDEVRNCIMATNVPQKPKNNIARVLCDADMLHLGSENYFEYVKTLRKELKLNGVIKLNKLDFDKESIKFFNKHKFHTNYCKGLPTKNKKKNLLSLKERVAKRDIATETAAKKEKKYFRGVDSMFKLTARNQINLSSIADNKSNILISLNGIIISLGLAGLVRKFQEEPAIIVPTIIFITFSLTTIILAILSTRPNISSGKFSKKDIKKRRANMLFFGNFYKMEISDYEWAMKEMISDDKYLYSSLVKDQFYLGQVLAKKYKLLRWAYNIFMVGLIVSVLTFLIVFLNL